jgi:hypothetical protein
MATETTTRKVPVIRNEPFFCHRSNAFPKRGSVA